MLEFLKTAPRKTVSLDELARYYGAKGNYQDFADEIAGLVDRGVLVPIRSQGTNLRNPPLANGYRINRAAMKDKLRHEIERLSFSLDPVIRLDAYYGLPEEELRRDLPYIEKLDAYIREKGLPPGGLMAAELSYELVGDEKWLEEKGGWRLLERLRLKGLFTANSLPDPLMLAVNPRLFGLFEQHHLIVENKAAYYALAEVLPETPFSSLIYGAGWRIVPGIRGLERQLNLPEKVHRLHYFGDLDFEGIAIWNALSRVLTAELALPFYEALLERPASKGKETQRPNHEALSAFLMCFSTHRQQLITEALNGGLYYPQEGLGREQMQEIARHYQWV